MARFHDIVGYEDSRETSSGIWSGVKETVYDGDTLEMGSRWTSRYSTLIENVDITARVSIIADPYAFANYQKIRYIHIDGQFWEVKSVTKSYPRLILTVGGVYNGETAST